MDNSAQIIQPPTPPTLTIELPPTAQQASVSSGNSQTTVNSTSRQSGAQKSSLTIDAIPSQTPTTFTPTVSPLPTFIANQAQPQTGAISTPQVQNIPLAPTQNGAPIVVPTVTQMEATLKQSGELAGEIAVQSVPATQQGPLAAIQPASLQEQQNFTQTISTPTTDTSPATLPGKVELANSELNKYLAKMRSVLHRPVGKLIALGLIIQGLRGVGQSARFILVDFPILEQQLVAHNLTQSQVNDHAIGAVMIMTSTVLSLFFAMRLTILHNKAAKTFNTVISILLVIGNQFIHDYLAQFDLANQIGTVSTESLTTLQAGSESFLMKILNYF